MDPHTPLISILIPVANGAEFLFESLSSVLQQTYTNWECIIALNGVGLSGPAEAIATAFDDARIRVLKLPTATTKVAALNEAMTHVHSDAEWIALLDVDDRWYPTKLAKQVAALNSNTAVVGTFAEYFGDMQGRPYIPAGIISRQQILSENPIINSSAIIKKEYARWEYHPDYQEDGGCLEDYYLWMKISLTVQLHLQNIPECLVAHRVHATSAFNSRQKSSALLQNWYLQRIQQPLTILTTVCNNPAFIRAQYAALSKYVSAPWTFVVFNDAKDWSDITNFGDPSMRQQIEATCRELGISCISVPNQNHRYIHSASQRHCDTLRFVMDFISRAPKGRFWMLDSDMWPVAPYTVQDLNDRFQGAGTFVRQVRETTTYAWPNLWWLDTRSVGIEGLSWNLAPACDTGGASASWIATHSNSLSWLPRHLGSCTWGSKDLPTHLVDHVGILDFLQSDPRNPGPDVAWSELYDEGRIFHVRAASNWNGEGAAIHSHITNMVTKHFVV